MTDQETPTATLTVRRVNARWRDRHRKYEVWVDGGIRGALKRGESITVPVPPGKHVVLARIAWTGSRPFEVDLAGRESVTVDIRPARSAFNVVRQVRSKDGWLTIQQVE